MGDEYEALRRILEELGEDKVRLKQGEEAWGGPGVPTHSFLSEWLRKLEADRARGLNCKG